jgi:TatD DNase family protein
MILIDTHAHLYLKEFKTDLTSIIDRAKAEGVEQIYLPAIDSETMGDLLELEGSFTGTCYAMAGLHPCSVNENYEMELNQVKKWLETRRFSAIGEIGLDFYWDKSFEKQQYKAFEQQIQWALYYSIPIVIHSREAVQECLQVVRTYQEAGLRGIFHCFSGSYELARSIIDTGFYLGIGGVVTYKNSGLAESIKNIPLDNLVLETDAPYLTPVPFRGKRNESSYLKFIVEKLAEVKGVSKEEVAKVTTENALKIFR